MRRHLTSWHALLARNSMIALGCATLGVGLAAAVSVLPMRGAAADVLRMTQAVVGPALVERCAADPAGFAIEAEGVSLYTYDPTTLESLHPDAPPVDERLAERWRAGEATPARFFADGPWGGAALIDSHTGGPCGVAQVRWAQPGGARLKLALGLMAVAVVSLALTAGLATTLTVRPLLRRLDQLRAAADGLGTGGYRSAPRSPGDPLDRLASVLDDAHARALGAREAEANRRAALEAHLDDVAHDLRTPLTALQLHLEAAAADASPAQRGRLEAALGDVTYLAQLTGNLRADAALRGPPADARCDLAGIVARVVARFEVIGHHAGIEVAGVVPEAPVVVSADPALAEQAIANLLHNAVRHNRPGGHVSAWLQASPGGFRLEIADDGPGVPPERLPTLGDPRTGRARRQLGLVITRAVCARAGWTITFAPLQPSGLQAVVEGPIVGDPNAIHGSSTPAA